jgi:hypothetical protein
MINDDWKNEDEWTDESRLIENKMIWKKISARMNLKIDRKK